MVRGKNVYSNDEVIEGIIHRDKEIILYIYDHCYTKVWKYVKMKGGTSEDAEDCFQLSVLKFIIDVEKKKVLVKGDVLGYFLGVCKNTWKMEIRKRINEPVYAMETVYNEASPPHVDSDTLEEQDRLYRESFERLTNRCKSVLRLRFEGHSYGYITDELKFNSEQLARNRMYECRRMLISIIKKDPRFNEIND